MTGNDRTILLVIPLIAAVIAFWMLAISPKREEASKLDKQKVDLQAAVDQQQQAAEQGLQARKSFRTDYHRLVVMGKAVPADDETASLVLQLNRIARDAGADFRGVTLSSSPDSAAAAEPAPTTAPAPEESGDSTSGESSATDTPASSTAGAVTSVPATESSAANLPIGATVGSAGLPTVPFELVFRGNFFEMADFMAGVDRMVKTRKSNIAADGRLVTVDGFTMQQDDARPFPIVKTRVQITTYATPADQGLTAGATTTGPAPALTSATPATPAP